MKPECYGEEGSPRDISLVLFEELLDEFDIYFTEFYDEMNESSETICYQEFGSDRLPDSQNLRTVIGKRDYAVLGVDKEDGQEG